MSLTINVNLRYRCTYSTLRYKYVPYTNKMHGKCNMIKMLRLKGDKFMTCQRRYVQHGSTKRDKFETCRVQYVQTGSLGPGTRSRRKVIFYS